MTPCERSIRVISLRLDGEASELESAALDRHLATCEHCREIAAGTTAATYLLRTAPLLEPERRVVVTSPRRARRQLVRRTTVLVLAAASLAAAAGLTVIFEPGPKHPSSALGFRDVNEQRKFVESELIRLEPQTVLTVQTAPRFAGHGLL